MLTRLHRRASSRVAAALVAVALSGAAGAAEQVSATPAGHDCRCPKRDHDCACPVCRALRASRAREAAGPPCHAAPAPARDDRDAERDDRRGDDRCRIASACHVPEAAAALDGREAFTLGEAVALATAPPLQGRPGTAIAPPDRTRAPDVPPPR